MAKHTYKLGDKILLEATIVDVDYGDKELPYRFSLGLSNTSLSHWCSEIDLVYAVVKTEKDKPLAKELSTEDVIVDDFRQAVDNLWKKSKTDDSSLLNKLKDKAEILETVLKNNPSEEYVQDLTTIKGKYEAWKHHKSKVPDDVVVVIKEKYYFSSFEKDALLLVAFCDDAAAGYDENTDMVMVFIEHNEISGLLKKGRSVHVVV